MFPFLLSILEWNHIIVLCLTFLRNQGRGFWMNRKGETISSEWLDGFVFVTPQVTLTARTSAASSPRTPWSRCATGERQGRPPEQALRGVWTCFLHLPTSQVLNWFQEDHVQLNGHTHNEKDQGPRLGRWERAGAKGVRPEAQGGSWGAHRCVCGSGLVP